MSDAADSRKDIKPVSTAHGPTARARKPYARPLLEPLGDIRDVTMANSGGVGESGAPKMRKA
jgi:hypothetical protein